MSCICTPSREMIVDQLAVIGNLPESPTTKVAIPIPTVDGITHFRLPHGRFLLQGIPAEFANEHGLKGTEAVATFYRGSWEKQTPDRFRFANNLTVNFQDMPNGIGLSIHVPKPVAVKKPKTEGELVDAGVGRVPGALITRRIVQTVGAGLFGALLIVLPW